MPRKVQFLKSQEAWEANQCPGVRESSVAQRSLRLISFASFTVKHIVTECLGMFGILKSRGAHSAMTFHDDIEDFRFSMTDFVAWNVCRSLNKEKVNFLEYAEGKIEIFIASSERDRGRPLPLLGNWSTSSS